MNAKVRAARLKLRRYIRHALSQHHDGMYVVVGEFTVLPAGYSVNYVIPFLERTERYTAVLRTNFEVVELEVPE